MDQAGCYPTHSNWWPCPGLEAQPWDLHQCQTSDPRGLKSHDSLIRDHPKPG
jgi:hypothetical protein